MSETTIKTEEYEVTAKTTHEAVSAILALEDDTCTETAYLPGTGEISPQELVEAWERKSGCSDLSSEARAAYCDAAEKLSVVLDGGVLTESP